MLLVITASGDVHAEPVLDEFDRRGLPYLVVDPGLFPQNATWAVNCGDDEVLELDGTSIQVSEVSCAWFRKPSIYSPDRHLDIGVSHWLQEERRQFVDSVLALVDAFWVSAPDAIRTASRKLVQLREATRLGFTVPEFTVTNRPGDAREFIAAFPDGVIVKSLGAPAVEHDGTYYSLYTHLVTKDDLARIDSVANGPTFLQRFIPKTADIRVTVIDGNSYAARIESQELEETRVDFRRGFDETRLRHSAIRLPESLGKACCALVRRFGLAYGAIDLVETNEQEYIFLELNPNGQYLWVEEQTALPLTQAMTAMLAAHTSATVKVQAPRDRRHAVVPVPTHTLKTGHIGRVRSVGITGVDVVRIQDRLALTSSDAEVFGSSITG